MVAVLVVRLPVVDDLRAELARLFSLEEDDAALYSKSMADVRAARMSVEEFAKVVGTRVLPAWGAESQTVASLRIPGREAPPLKAVFDAVVGHISQRSDAWQGAGPALTSKNVAMMTAVDQKNAEVAAFMRVTVNALQGRKTPDADPALENLRSGLRTLVRLEREGGDLYNSTLRRLQSNDVTPATFAEVIEKKVLPPWEHERQALLPLSVPDYRQMYAKIVVDYMALKADAFRSTAEGVRTSNMALIRKARKKVTPRRR